MATRGRLMAAGMPAGQSVMIGANKATGLSGAGTSSQTAATALNDVNVAFFSTAAANSGARLPVAEGSPPVAIYNGGSNPLLVYPATGESINNLSANASFSVTNAKGAVFIPAESGQWAAILSA